MSEISPIEQARRDLETKFTALSPQEAAKSALALAGTSPAGFRVFILSAALQAIAAWNTRSQSERVSRLEEAEELLKDAQYHLRADTWAEQFNGRVNAFLSTLNQGADDGQ